MLTVKSFTPKLTHAHTCITTLIKSTWSLKLSTTFKHLWMFLTTLFHLNYREVHLQIKTIHMLLKLAIAGYLYSIIQNYWVMIIADWQVPWDNQTTIYWPVHILWCMESSWAHVDTKWTNKIQFRLWAGHCLDSHIHGYMFNL